MRRGVKIFGGVVVVLVGLYVWPFLVPLPQRTTEPIVPPFPAEYGAAAVADLEAAETLYREGAFQAAYDLWKPLAEAGNPEAQFRIGRLYDRGELFAQDEDEGLRWFQLAAEQDHALALTTLFAIHHERGVDNCDSEMQRMLVEAAHGGSPNAQFNLSVSLNSRYQCEKYIDRSTEALYWLKRAAKQGNPNAIVVIFGELTDRTASFKETEDSYFRFYLSAEQRWWSFPVSFYLYLLLKHEAAKSGAISRYLKWRPTLEVRMP
jgi:TPR repeat protein